MNPDDLFNPGDVFVSRYENVLWDVPAFDCGPSQVVGRVGVNETVLVVARRLNSYYVLSSKTMKLGWLDDEVRLVGGIRQSHATS